MVLRHLFDERQTRLADFGQIPECISKNSKGLNEILLPLARMVNWEMKSTNLQVVLVLI